MERNQGMVNSTAPRCPYCHDSVTVHSSKQACESCMAWHHKECWQEHGGCSGCGGQKQSSPATISPKQESQEPLPPHLATCFQRICQSPRQTVLKNSGYEILCREHAHDAAKTSVKVYTVILGLLPTLSLMTAWFMAATDRFFVESAVILFILCLVTLLSIVQLKKQKHYSDKLGQTTDN
ncbi:MAG: hypothetical protein P1V97_29850 [Planctomycetota bacterium]|nr:hypothetical protein [Planctomycetota bacterium]